MNRCAMAGFGCDVLVVMDEMHGESSWAQLSRTFVVWCCLVCVSCLAGGELRVASCRDRSRAAAKQLSCEFLREQSESIDEYRCLVVDVLL